MVVKQATMPRISAAGAVPDEVLDLSTAHEVDHYAVFADIGHDITTTTDTASGRPQPAPTGTATKYDHKSTKDPAKRAAFQHRLAVAHQTLSDETGEMLKHDCSPLALDSRLERWSHLAREAAEATFTKARTRPTQPWMSDNAWRFMRQVAPARRRCGDATASQKKVAMRMLFHLWRLTTPLWANDRWTPETPANTAAHRAATTPHTLAGYDRDIAIATHTMTAARAAARTRMRLDKATYLENRATAAQEAADRGE